MTAQNRPSRETTVNATYSAPKNMKMGSAKGRLGGLRGGKFQVQNLYMILRNVELLRYDAPCDFDGKKAVGMKY